jgi:hypothetical protein
MRRLKKKQQWPSWQERREHRAIQHMMDYEERIAREQKTATFSNFPYAKPIRAIYELLLNKNNRSQGVGGVAEELSTISANTKLGSPAREYAWSLRNIISFGATIHESQKELNQITLETSVGQEDQTVYGNRIREYNGSISVGEVYRVNQIISQDAMHTTVALGPDNQIQLSNRNVEIGDSFIITSADWFLAGNLFPNQEIVEDYLALTKAYKSSTQDNELLIKEGDFNNGKSPDGIRHMRLYKDACYNNTSLNADMLQSKIDAHKKWIEYTVARVTSELNAK